MVARKSGLNFFDLKPHFLKPIFDWKYLKNTLGTMTSKNQKNHTKNWINSKPKIKLGLNLFFQGKKKYLIRTPLIKWNYLTQISIFLMVYIGVNDIFSLHYWNPAASFYSETEK
jgi:hypothetical protein